jgi:hypothetical protein
LDAEVSPGPDATREDVPAAIDEYILRKGMLVG